MSWLQRVRDFVAAEPVVVRALVSLIVAAAATFGFDVDAEQLFVILAVLGVVSTPVVRSKVSPVKGDRG